MTEHIRKYLLSKPFTDMQYPFGEGIEVYKVKGKMFAMAVRVPVITGSLVELNCIVEKDVTIEEINTTFKAAAEGAMKGILQYADAPLVSSDIIGNKYSSIFDAQLTKVDGKMIKVVSWYDNEAGYSARLSDFCVKVASLTEAVLS